MHRHSDCSRCHRSGTVVRPSSAWTAALLLAYAVFVVMIFGAGLLGPTIMVVIPLLAAFGLGVLPFVHARVGAPASCTACGTIADPSAASREPSATAVVPATATRAMTS